MSLTQRFISPETMKEHRVRWYTYVTDDNGKRERIPCTSMMRGFWPGYDVVCSCGWDSETGGATKSTIQDMLLGHRLEVQRETRQELSPRDQADRVGPAQRLSSCDRRGGIMCSTDILICHTENAPGEMYPVTHGDEDKPIWSLFANDKPGGYFEEWDMTLHGSGLTYQEALDLADRLNLPGHLMQ